MPILGFQIMRRFKTTYYVIIYWYAEQTSNTIFSISMYLPETKIKILCLITNCTNTLTNIIDNNILVCN